MDAPPPDPPRSARGRRPVVALVGIVLAAAGASGAWLASRHPEALPVYWELPDFSLVDQQGRGVQRRDLAGAPWIADFIFTRCAGTCPAMTARMARLRPRLPPAARLVSISVDPAHDTPEAMARYAAQFDAGPDWLFLTGSREALHGLSVDGFKLEAMEIPAEEQRPGVGDGPFLHSSKFVLVDGRGGVRGYYDSTDGEAMDRLVSDATRLAEERR